VELKALAANPAKAAVDGDGKRFEPRTVHWIRLYGLNPFRFDTGALVARKIGLVSGAALFRDCASLVTWGVRHWAWQVGSALLILLIHTGG